MLRRKMGGFTLIELMVVIVIIGVLASLAIPRFTEASSKAKIAEAPRVLASYESAQLAAIAENSFAESVDALVFDVGTVNLDSKWFAYTAAGATSLIDATCNATVKKDIGAFKNADADGLITTVSVAGTIVHSTVGKIVAASAKKMVPNFLP